MYIQSSRRCHNITFRQIEFFIAACQEGSFSRAAKKLLVSQQSVSKAVQELEDELNVTLVKRDSKGLSLTTYGAFVYEEFLRILQKKNNLITHVHDMKSIPREPLLIGMSYGVISALSPTFLKDFERNYPYILLEYEDHPDSVLISRYDSEKYDYILTIGPLDRTDTNTELIKREQTYLCIPKGHPLYDRSGPFTMEDLRPHPFVMFDHHFKIRENFMSVCKHAGFEPNIYLSSGDYNSLLELSVNTTSLFVVPAHTIRKNYVMRYEPFPDEHVTWDILLAVKKSKVITPSMSDFHQFLLESTKKKSASE